MRLLDLFSAAAGGWSLGMHRAGFQTVAACEWIEWRRALYAENNPGVLIYDDVRTLTADRLRADLGALPDIVVGSPPCQDISSANTKGRGVDGERSGLFFEAVRIIGECRPRWFALENSANLRTRGADAVLAALEGHGYACWPLVVRARDVGANHERPRCWLIGCDVGQLAHAPEVRRAPWPRDREGIVRRDDGRVSGGDDCDGLAADADRNSIRLAELSGGPVTEASLARDAVAANDVDTASIGHEGGRTRGHGPDGVGAAHAGDATGNGRGSRRSRRRAVSAERLPLEACGDAAVAHSYGQGQPDSAEHGEVGRSEGAGDAPAEPWADWNGGLAHHLRLDDGLSTWVAGTRVAVGGPRGTSAASLLVEAFGDAVVPQIPEAIGNAIWRVEAAMAAVRDQRAAA